MKIVWIPALLAFVLSSTGLDASLRAEELTVCPSGCDFETIQEAIDAADEGDTILIFPGTYHEGLVIDKSLSLVGEDRVTTFVDALDSSDTVVVADGATVTLRQLTLTGGSGAGLCNSGTVSVHSCDIIENGVRGVFNDFRASVELYDSTISGHRGAGRGGAILNSESSSTVIERCVISDNSADSGGAGFNDYGGAFFLRDSLVCRNKAQVGGGFRSGCDTQIHLERSRLEDNFAGQYGGAIAFDEIPAFPMTAVDVVFANNQAGEQGGGVSIGASWSFVRCSFLGNRAAIGGGFYSSSFGEFSDGFSFTNCLFEGNCAETGGGGAFIEVTDDFDEFSPPIIFDGTTFHNNRAIEGHGGALAMLDCRRTRIVNSTLTKNECGARGGALYASTGASEFFQLDHCTVSHNSSPNGSGLCVEKGFVSLRHTILAQNYGGGDCDGTVFSDGYNILGDSSCQLDGVGDRSGVDPRLGPLQYLGGPTPVRPLLSQSPAIDFIPRRRCDVLFDQRGEPRPSGNRCDCGAYERQQGQATGRLLSGR